MLRQNMLGLAIFYRVKMTMPSVSEVESLTRMMNTLIKPVRQFDNGFKDLGNREYLRKH